MNLNKRGLCFLPFILLITIISCFLSGCGGDEETGSEISSEENTVSDEIIYPNINTAFTLDKKLLESSLLNKGNDYRMMKFFEKVVSGEPVNIIYYGGASSMGLSATALGEKGYSALVNDWFAKHFPESIVETINSGLNGMSSILGVALTDRNVIDYEPDLVIIDFAVEDLSDLENKVAFEGTILKILKSEKKPAVALLFNTTRDGYTCQSWMEDIGRYYSLPMISMRDSIYNQIQSGEITWEDYSNDDALPNENGHLMLSELLIYWLDSEYKDILSLMENSEESEQAEPAEPPEYVIPEEPVYANIMENMLLIDSESYTPYSSGSFTKLKYSSVDFPNAWVKKPLAGNESIIFKVNTKNFILVYKQICTPEYGTLEVLVNGRLHTTLDGNTGPAWESVSYKQIVFNMINTNEYTIELRMAPGDENKMFLLLGACYTPDGGVPS